MSDLQPNPARLPDVPEGTAPCGGCDGVLPSTPQAVHNRQGLGAIAYRAGTWAQFRASLQAGLSDSTLAPLNALLMRDSTDFSIALVDAFACSADVLAFHTERIAQESYLPTATEHVSLQELGKLIGYRLRPGVAAETALAFSVETPPQPPAAMAPEPGVFVHGVPDAVPILAGFKVQSLPGPDEKPQVFETVEALEARAGWNAMRALPDADVVPGFGARSTWLAGTATQLKVGDMLIFAGAEFEADATSNRWDARVLTTVQTDAAANRTMVAWDEPLGSVLPPLLPVPGTATSPTLYALRERAAIFGHNAPDWSGMSNDYKAAYLQKTVDELTDEDLEEWPQFDIYAPGGTDLRRLRFLGAQEAADAMREVLRGALLQTSREGTLAVSRMVAGGAAFVQQVAAEPMNSAGKWQQVAAAVPGALQELAGVLTSPIEALTGEDGALTQLGDTLKRSLDGLSALLPGDED